MDTAPPPKVLDLPPEPLADDDQRGLLLGSADVDINGNSHNNHLRGNDGNNRLDGADGEDTLLGGLGDDTYVVDSAGDRVQEAPDHGHDRVEAALDYTLSANVEDLVLTGAAENGSGNDLGNRLDGNDLDNRLSGQSGNDTLDGGAGMETTATRSTARGTPSSIWQMPAWMRSSPVYSHIPWDHLENLMLAEDGPSISAYGNEFDNRLTGNGNDNLLESFEGRDTLLGGAGRDVLTGGAGDDELDGGLDEDTYVYAPGDGIDTIRGDDLQNDELQLAVGAEAVSFSQQGTDLWVRIGWGDSNRIRVVDFFRDDVDGNSALRTITTLDGVTYRFSDLQAMSSVYATEGDDYIELSNGDKAVYALGGQDTVIGSADDDVPYGGLGDDWLRGGEGNDILVDNQGSRVNLGAVYVAEIVMDLAEVRKRPIGCVGNF